jgi:hypothetical protein
MNRFIIIVLLSVSLQSQASQKYSSVELAVRSIALEFCACKYLMERDNSFCSDYVFEGTPLPRFMFSIEHDKKKRSTSVSSRLALGFVSSKTFFKNENCEY